jgi:small conductance mechanosensitive channel
MEADQIIEASAYAIAADFIAMLPRIGMALCLLALTWLVIALANRGMQQVLKRTRMRRALAELVIEIADVGIWVVALFIAAAVAFPSVTPANIMTGLGLGTVAIGFAFRDIFENFLAGVLILYREPFRLGDCIECAKIEGFVEEITARDTHLRQTDGQRVVLPNAMLFKNPVTVRTDKDIRRTTIFCRLAFGVDVDAARKVLRQAVESLDTASKESGVQIFAHAFTEDGIEFEVTWWTGSRPVDIRRSRDQVITAVTRALDEAGFKIAIPRRMLAFDTALEISTSDRSATGRGEGIAQVRRRAGESGGRRSPELLNRHTNPGE